MILNMLKKMSKRTKAAVCVTVLVLLYLFVTTLTVGAAEGGPVTGVDGLQYSYNGNQGISVEATESKKLVVKATGYESGGISSTTNAATDTITLKNELNIRAYLEFKYSVTANEGKVTIDNKSITTDVANQSFSKLLEAGGTINISIESKKEKSKTTTLTLTEIILENRDPKEIDLKVGEHGKVQDSYSGTTYNAGQTGTITVPSGSSTTLKAIPDSGYKFYAYLDGNNNVVSTNAEFCPSASGTLTAVFISKDTAVYMVGSKYFTDLNDAITEAGNSGKIIVVDDGTVPAGDYTIPNGVKLLVPYDNTYVDKGDNPDVIYGSHTIPTAFRTLTMAKDANIIVENGGSIELGSKLCSKGQFGTGNSEGWNGCPTGPDGRIEMRSGSAITLNDGAKLYTWGYIYGSGDIEAKSGSTVYEAFQIKDWRGGTRTSNIYEKTFIFSQYYIQNIEVPVKFYAGANEQLYSSVNASSSAYPIGVELIGDGNAEAMFKLSSGYLEKDYIEATDKTEYRLNGNAEISYLQVTGVPMVGSVNTKDYELPFNGNMTIDVKSGTTKISQDIKLLPGAEVSVQPNAAIELNSGKYIYLYDKEDWGHFVGSGTEYMYPVGYSVANGTDVKRTFANMPDARIDVNGTFIVNGQFYTSSHGADITSTLGSSEEQGRIVYNTPPAANNKTIQEDEANKTLTGVTMQPANLRNGDGNYSQTQNTGASTWYYDKPGEHWYRYLVDFMYNGKLIYRDYYCEDNDKITYTADWLSSLEDAVVSSGDATVDKVSDAKTVTVTNVTSDSKIDLTGTPYQYIPTFVLDEKQYSIYQLYTGRTLSKKESIDGKTYYVVNRADSAMEVGAEFAAPAAESMGITAEKHNSIIWNLSGISYTSGDPYRGTVPAGSTVGGPAYIYGFYDGYVAYNVNRETYYKALIDAVADLDTDETATIKMVADCGTYEEESSKDTLYTFYQYQNITLDLNGHKAVGRIINNGTMTLELNGGTFDYHTGATSAAVTYKSVAAVTNEGTLTIQDSVGGGKVTTDAVSNASGTSSAAIIRNNQGATLTVSNAKLSSTQNVADSYSYGLLNISGGIVSELTNCTIELQKSNPIYNLGTINTISGGSYSTQSENSSIYNASSGKITTITGATSSSPKSYALSNAGTITTVTNSTLTSTSNAALYNTKTITTITESTIKSTSAYGVHNNGGTITTIGANTVVESGSHAIYNVNGTITTIGGSSKNNKVSIKCTGSGNALYNSATTKNATIKTIKYAYFQSKSNVIVNGDTSDTGYIAKITKITSGTECYTTGNYSAVNNRQYGVIASVASGAFRTAGSTVYALLNQNPNSPIMVTGGYFRNNTTGTESARRYAVSNFDDPAYITYDTGKGLSSAANTYSLASTSSLKIAALKTNGYYYITDSRKLTFDMQGHGTAPTMQIVDSNQNFTAPSSPAANSTVTEDNVTYRFDGWYQEADCTNEFDFSVAPTADVTAYAKWTPVYTVTWMSQDGTGTLETDTNVESGTKPSFDGTEPTKAGDGRYTYTFAGWATEADQESGTTVENLPNVTGDATYYAAFSKTELERKHSLTLKGEIGVNFYIPAADVEAADNGTVTMNWGPVSGADHGEAVFEIKNLTFEDTVVYHTSDEGLNQNNPLAVAKKANEDYYQFTAYVAAKQMADEITLTITDGNNNDLTDTYRVADYCNKVIADKDNEVSAKLGYDSDKFAKLQTLCKSMLTYGSRAQTQFSYNTEHLADEGIDYTYTPAQASDFAEYYKAENMSGTNDMAYYGSSLLLEAETTYSVWFRYEDNNVTPPEATATIDNKEVTVEKMSVGEAGEYDANYVRYNILNLPANLLTKDIKVIIGGTEKTYNVRTYFYLALQSEDPVLTNTVTSLYDYNQKAVDFFG